MVYTLFDPDGLLHNNQTALHRILSNYGGGVYRQDGLQEDAQQVVISFATDIDAVDADIQVTSGSPTQAALSVAYQRHLLSKPTLHTVLDISPLSLGAIREDWTFVEPFVRHGRSVLWKADAIRRSDFGTGPVTGLTSEEACQIGRFIGESDQLTSIIFEVPNQAPTDQWIDCYLTIIWYVLEGRTASFREDLSSTAMQKVVIPIEEIEVTLLVSHTTKRVWLHRFEQYHPIHQSEYEMIRMGELPKRLEKLLLD